MGTSTIATQARAPPSSLRTQKGTVTESGAWRLRSRSYSHDNELYRMGLRKTAQGEWAAVDNKVPAGLADAMRRMRIRSVRSATRVKREDVEIEMGDGEEDEDGETGEEAEEMVVFDYEEIRVYIDVEREVEGGLVCVDERGMKVETVMRSVEMKSEFGVDVKMKGSESGDRLDSVAGETRPEDGNRDSLASIVEEEEDRMDVDRLGGEEQQEGVVDMTNTADPETRPMARRRRKWTDYEMRYVGALLDGGYKLSSIVDLFHDRFPHADEVTLGSLAYCRERILYQSSRKHWKPIRLLAEELGLVTGKWQKLDYALKFQEKRELEEERVVAKEKQIRIERLRETLYWQQLQRILSYQRRRAATDNSDRGASQEQDTRPLWASEIVGFVSGAGCEEELLTALLYASEDDKESLEAALRPGLGGTEKIEALLDYQMQLRLLELANRKRLLMARQEQDNKPRSAPLDAKEYSKLLMQAVQQKKKEGQDHSLGDHDESATQRRPKRLEDYQMQLMLLEQQNKHRLLMARQEQDSLSTSAPVAAQEYVTPFMLTNQQDTSVGQDHLLEQHDEGALQRPAGLQDDEMHKLLLDAWNRQTLLSARPDQVGSSFTNQPVGLYDSTTPLRPFAPDPSLLDDTDTRFLDSYFGGVNPDQYMNDSGEPWNEAPPDRANPLFGVQLESETNDTPKSTTPADSWTHGWNEVSPDRATPLSGVQLEPVTDDAQPMMYSQVLVRQPPKPSDIVGNSSLSESVYGAPYATPTFSPSQTINETVEVKWGTDSGFSGGHFVPPPT